MEMERLWNAVKKKTSEQLRWELDVAPVWSDLADKPGEPGIKNDLQFIDLCKVFWFPGRAHPTGFINENHPHLI